MSVYKTLWSGKRLDGTLVLQIHPDHVGIIFFHMQADSGMYVTGQYEMGSIIVEVDELIDVVETLYLKAVMAKKDRLLSSKQETLQ